MEKKKKTKKTKKRKVKKYPKRFDDNLIIKIFGVILQELGKEFQKEEKPRMP